MSGEYTDPSEIDNYNETEEPGETAARPKVIGYTRVSTKRQETSGLSLAAQRDRIMSFAKLHDLDLVECVADVTSGATPIWRRPEGARLVGMVDTGAIDKVIVTSIDRVGRRMHEAVHAIETWRRQGIGLVVLNVNGFSMDFESDLGKVVLAILACFSELELNALRLRTKEGLRARRAFKRLPEGTPRMGEHLVCPRCGGTKRDSAQRDFCGNLNCGAQLRLHPNPQELATMGMIWEMRVDQGIPWRQICVRLAALKRPTKKKDHTHWHKTTCENYVRRMKKNPRLLADCARALAEERGDRLP